MIKGLAITPPALGRISIGRVVEKNGKRLPEKDDQFTITSQIQSKEGWIKHPLDDQLRANTPNQKLRSIPVRMIFNDPDLNLRAEYSLFDRQTGRPVCVGNGETCQRLTNQGVEQHPCPSPDLCPLAQGGNCKPYGRLHVNLDDSDEFELTLRGKSTTQSYRQPVYYVDLTLREGISLNDAIAQARQIDEQSKQAGFYQEALDFTARKGFANARFETDIEEGLDVLEEYYPEHEQNRGVEQQASPEGFMQDIQQGLQRSVRPVN